MKIADLVNSAEIIVSRNITKATLAATVAWSEADKKLTVRYYLDSPSTDEDVEECELSMCELLADYADIAKAETECIHSPNSEVYISPSEHVVFVRRK